MFVVVVQDFIVDVHIPVCCWLHGDIMGSHDIMRYPKFLVGKRSWWNSTHHVAASSWISQKTWLRLFSSIWAVFCSKTIEILPWKTGWFVLELIIHRRFWTNHTSHIGSLSESHSSPMKTPVSHPMKKSPNKNPTPSWISSKIPWNSSLPGSTSRGGISDATGLDVVPPALRDQ